jgi:hypothetical protein
MRFRRSFKLTRGIRINVGKRGITSLSLGRRGSTINLGGSNRSSSGGSRYSDGLTAAERKAIKLEGLNDDADRQNSLIDEAINQQRKIKAPETVINEFLNPAPSYPSVSCGYGVAFVLFALLTNLSVYFAIPAAILFLFFAKKALDYDKSKKAHKAFLKERKELYELAKTGEDQDAIEKVLNIAINGLDFFFDTTCSFNINTNENSIYLDIDFPEIEDMPTSISIVRKTRMSIEQKPKKDAEIRRDYIIHIHGLSLRIVSVIFALFPTIATVTVSGYTQRRDEITEDINDNYVLSVKFTRYDFERTVSPNVDPIICISRFPNKRSMTKDGLLETIIPFTPNE